MTLDASSLATLADVKRGGCCGRAYGSCYVSVVREAGLAFVHCIVDVSWEFWSHAGHSCSACKFGVGGISENVEHGYPKACRPNVCLTKGCLTRPAMWTVLEPRPTTEGSSWALPVLPAKLWKRGDPELVTDSTAQYSIQYNLESSQTPNASKCT